MMRYTRIFLVTLALSLVLSPAVVGAGQAVANRSLPVPEEERVPLPNGLRIAFENFCALINERSTKEKTKTVESRLGEYVLPGAVHIELSGYREKPWENEINVPFLFHHRGWEAIWRVTELKDQSFKIETRDTILYFVQTSSKKWRLYRITYVSDAFK